MARQARNASQVSSAIDIMSTLPSSCAIVQSHHVVEVNFLTFRNHDWRCSSKNTEVRSRRRTFCSMFSVFCFLFSVFRFLFWVRSMLRAIGLRHPAFSFGLSV